MRATLIVLDSVGVGAMPDADEWGDAGTDTLGHTADRVGGLNLPNLERLGLANIRPVQGLNVQDKPEASYGKAAIASAGKDTIVGHWEMAGVPVKKAFKCFEGGFPAEIIDEFVERIGRGILGNVAASGTAIIEELGSEHMETELPIVYTSSDSVFQIACHEAVIDVDTLYAWCEEAFRIVTAHGVARVIARPFLGEPGSFARTENRHDFAVQPPIPTVCDILQATGERTTSIGKVESIFGNRGFTDRCKSPDNATTTDRLLERLDAQPTGLIFANYVDFDMLFGHRRDPEGYAAALERFDESLPAILERMTSEDLLILTADHGNDPTHTGTDHTREYVPILAWRKNGSGTSLGTRDSLADMGATIAEWFGVESPHGTSFLSMLA